MTPDESRLVARLAEQLASVTTGRPLPDVASEAGADVDPGLAALAATMGRLLHDVREARAFATALADGQLQVDAPRGNPFVHALKALQASLRHLTWQTQEVAQGRLHHRVDFLGEFSQAFNQMIASLREKQRTDREALESSRLASLGRLAGGIAHEINTPLQYIQSNVAFMGDSARALLDVAEAAGLLADAARYAPGLEDPVARVIACLDAADLEYVRASLPDGERSALEGLTRIDTVVKALLSFTSPARTTLCRADLPNLVDEVLTISESQWRPVAAVERRYAPAPNAVLVRVPEVQDALLRLVTNAILAVREAGDGRAGLISIATAVEGEMVALRVGDNGPGVPADLRERIFDPFFTTREVGHGMGLGLTICREIVTRHGGSLSVGDSASGGAEFTLRLPRAA